MPQRIIDCTGPILVGDIITDLNNKLDLKTGGTVKNSVIIDDDGNGSAILQVLSGTASATVKQDYFELKNNTNYFRIERDNTNQEIDFKINNITSLSLESGYAPKSPYQPQDVNHLTRKDYVDNALNTKLSLTGGTISGDLTVNGDLTGNFLIANENITALGSLNTGLNGNGNSGIQFNYNNGNNGVLWYDNTAAANVAFKLDTTIAGEGFSIWHTGNDGSGSGLDADTVDGLQASQLVQIDNASQVILQDLLLGNGVTGGDIILTAKNNTDAPQISFNRSDNQTIAKINADNAENLVFSIYNPDDGSSNPVSTMVLLRDGNIAISANQTSATLQDNYVITYDFLKTNFTSTSEGPSSAGMGVLLNNEGQIDVTMIEQSIFYLVGPWNPSDTGCPAPDPVTGCEYPDPTGESSGAFWVIEGLGDGITYEFITGDLIGRTITDGDFMVWTSGGWSIMVGEMNPNLYYLLDGSNALSGPFAGGAQQIKNIADGTDATDAISKAQLDAHNHDSTYVNISGDTMTGVLKANGLETTTGSVLRLQNYTTVVDPLTEYCSLFYNQQGVPELGITHPVLSFYSADSSDATSPTSKLAFAVYSDGAYHKILDERDINNFVEKTGDTMSGNLNIANPNKSSLYLDNVGGGNGSIEWRSDRGEGMKPQTLIWNGSDNPENWGISFNYDATGNNNCSFELKGIEHRVVVTQPDGSPFIAQNPEDLTPKQYVDNGLNNRALGGVRATAEDPNTLKTSGFMRVENHANNPTDDIYSYTISAGASNVVHQIAANLSGSKIYFRTFNTDWSSWKELYNNTSVMNGGTWS
jgi:hypothetical protein